MGDHALAEARIALENVRASAKSFAEAIADARAAVGGPASTEPAVVRRADVAALEGDAMRALGAMSRAARELLKNARAFIPEHPRLSFAVRRLEADLAIAAAVLRTMEHATPPHPKHEAHPKREAQKARDEASARKIG